MKHESHRGQIPPLEASELERLLRHDLPAIDLSPATLSALHLHFQELRRWNRTVSLIGQGTVEEMVRRHYAESLAALPFVGSGRLVDLGSGAGFPGLVLAVACPSLEVTLVESRQRKAAFLEFASRRSGVRCRVLAARVVLPLPAGLPEGIDFLTLRAVALDGRVWNALLHRLAPEGRVVHWASRDQAIPSVDLELEAETPLPGGEGRRLRVLRRKRNRDERSS